ncbi:MAG: hypothetical protein P9M06_05090 [Candidatus Saelkia tenebricola]|nr:hypothetical protein [Candidatus Saelkia tenebricola]
MGNLKIKGIVLFMLGIFLSLPNFVEARRIKQPLTSIRLEMAIRVESFPQVIRTHFAGLLTSEEEVYISGLDYGAGDGEKTIIIKATLEDVFGFGYVSFWGIDHGELCTNSESALRIGVQRMDLNDISDNSGMQGRMDIITIFAPAGALGFFVETAKKMIHPDGLIVVALYHPEMLELFQDRAPLGFWAPEELLKELTGFTFIRFNSDEGWSKGRIVPQGYCAFIYSPNGLKIDEL